MSDPTRYGWCPHGMRPSTVEFGPARYINEYDHDRVVAVLRAELDAARQLLAEAHERIVSLHGCFPPDHKRGSEAEKSNRVLSRINGLLMPWVWK